MIVCAGAVQVAVPTPLKLLSDGKHGRTTVPGPGQFEPEQSAGGSIQNSPSYRLHMLQTWPSQLTKKSVRLRRPVTICATAVGLLHVNVVVDAVPRIVMDR